MKILLLADLHSNRSWYEWLALQAGKHDLVCIAGDFLDIFAADTGGQINFLRGKWLPTMIATGIPIAVCSGNHDYPAIPWLAYIDQKNRVVGDGSTQLLTFDSGEQLVVTTCPYHRTFDRSDAVMIALWEEGARLREEAFAPWLILHHEPPEQCAPRSYTATHWLSDRLRAYRPTFVACGHVHIWHDYFAIKHWGAWVFNSDQHPKPPQPNHLILDTAANTITRVRMMPSTDGLGWVEERGTDFLE